MNGKMLGGFGNGRRNALNCGFMLAALIASGAALRAYAGVALVKETETPVVDGRLDDACWKGMTFDDDFQAPKLRADRGPLSRRTEFAICCDSDSVYIAIRCYETDIAGLKAIKEGSIWVRDNVEVFLAPGGTSFDYYHFGISPVSNDICEEYRSEGGNIQPDPYSPKWRHAIGWEKDAWTAEMAIPLSAFYMTRNSGWKTTWLVNVTRSLPRINEYASWSRLTRAFHTPSEFRKVGGFPVRRTADDRVVRAATAEIKSCEGGVFRGRLKLDIWTALAGEYVVKTSDGPETKIALKAGGNTVSVPCEYAKDGRIATDITLVDKAGHETSRAYPVFVEYRPIRIRLKAPQYRNNFYPGQDSSRVSGTVIVPKGVSAELSLEGPGFAAQTAKVAASGDFSFDTTGFQQGEAWLTVKAGTDVEKVRIRNLPPTGRTMTWVENGNLVVNGRPTLRRSIYAQGFMTGKAFDERFAKEQDSFRLTPFGVLCAEPNRLVKGLERREAIFDVKPCAEYLDVIRTTYEKRKDGDYAAWYICDEPECRSVSPVYLNHVYEYLKELDPYHIVFTASRGGEAYIDTADLFETHPYLGVMNDEGGKRVYGNAPNAVGAFIDAFAPDRHPDKCVGFLPTCFAYRWTSWACDYPTFDEYVLHTWAAMMRGGKTLKPYAGHDLGDRSALYNGTRYIFESFEALEELVLHGRRTTFLKENEMEGVLYELPDEKMFVVVNFATTNAVARLPGVCGGFREFRAERRFGADGAEVTPIEMKPLETIVATTKIHDANLEPKSETVARIDREEAERLGRDNQLLERTPDLAVNTNCKRNFGGGHYKLFDGTHEMIALHSRGQTNAYVEISCNGFRASFDKVRVWGWGIIDRLEVDVRKGGEWVPQKVESRRSEKYMHEVTLAEPVSTVKLRLRFPGRAKQPNELEVYEIELPRLADGVSVEGHASAKVLRDEGMSIVWDGSDCASSEKWGDKVWMYGDVAEPNEDGGFTMKKSGTRYMTIGLDDEWLVFDIAAFHNTGAPRAYRAWFASVNKLCHLGFTVSHPQPGVYSFPLPKRDKKGRYPLRIDIHGMTVDFNAIKLGRRPVDRVEVKSSTGDVIAPGSTVSVRACLSRACEEVAAELLSAQKTGGMRPFAVNGTKGLELKMLDEEGFVWGTDVSVARCESAETRSVFLKITPLGSECARPLFGSIALKFADSPEEAFPDPQTKSGIVDVLSRFNGNQPDHRLNEIAIRHWDGYWFGKRHTYGDTLHQHSALSARAYLWYARAGGDAAWRRCAEHTYRNILAMFTPDGRATAAYMLPLTVTMVNRDGSLAEPTRRVQGPDPLANDQDSALYNAMASGLFGNYGQNVSSIHAFAASNRRVKQ